MKIPGATDTSEGGLESLIVAAMVGKAGPMPVTDKLSGEGAATYGGTGWFLGNTHDYDREHAVDLVQLATFLRDTQPDVVDALDLGNAGPVRQTFLAGCRARSRNAG